MRQVVRILLLLFLATAGLFSAEPRRSSQVYFPGKVTKFYFFQRGEASWYGPGFEGRATASGRTFFTEEYTIAHNSIPLGEVVLIRNPRNGKCVVARVTDRGPFCNGRIADLSKKAMRTIGLLSGGVGEVEIWRTR